MHGVKKKKNLEVEDLEEEIVDKKNFKDLIKSFLINFRKNGIWVNIGVIISNTGFLWILYFYQITSLLFTISFSLGYPLVVFSIYFAQRSNRQVLVTKIELIGIGGFAIAFWICLFSLYFLRVAPWAPFHEVSAWEKKYYFDLGLLGIIYVIVAYLIYRYGNKKEWKFKFQQYW